MIDLITPAGGNLGSVRSLLERTATPFREITGPEQFKEKHPMLIPGVGSFGAVMGKLTESRLKEAITERAGMGVRLLGICSGMQVLFEESEESPGVKGLSLIPGRVKKLETTPIPNIGWSMLNGENIFVYFVNSYHALTPWATHTAEGITAIAQKGSVTGFQFHPEKSHRAGEELFRRWRDGL